MRYTHQRTILPEKESPLLLSLMGKQQKLFKFYSLKKTLHTMRLQKDLMMKLHSCQGGFNICTKRKGFLEEIVVSKDPTSEKNRMNLRSASTTNSLDILQLNNLTLELQQHKPKNKSSQKEDFKNKVKKSLMAT